MKLEEQIDKYFYHVFFKHQANAEFKLCLFIFQTYYEGTVSQILYLGLSFCFMTKVEKNTFWRIMNNYFTKYIKYDLGPLNGPQLQVHRVLLILFR